MKTNEDTHSSCCDSEREPIGWLALAGIILLFPALFFLCVFFPIWIGITPRFP